jgi:hypothetical protein
MQYIVLKLCNILIILFIGTGREQSRPFPTQHFPIFIKILFHEKIQMGHTCTR